ncbi:hypothetical protein ACA910_008313 [Epithemia clementina (nom. ined.)]
MDLESCIDEVLDGILVRYPSGPARIHRLHYFAQHVAAACAQYQQQNQQQQQQHSAAGGTSFASSSSSTGTSDSAILSMAIQKAYQAISDTCKLEGNVVRYRQIFGPSSQQQHMAAAAAAAASTNNPQSLSLSTAAAPEVSIPAMDPMIISNATTADSSTAAGETTATSSLMTTWTGMEYDVSWVEEQEEMARQSREVLEHRLQVAQSQLHKESIRTAYLALSQAQSGHHSTNHYGGNNNNNNGVGDLMQSFHALLRAKDYCTNRSQTTAVCLQIVSTALALGNTVAAAEYIHKLEHTLRSNNSTNNNNNNASAAAASASSNSSTELDFILVQTASALERILCGDFRRALQALKVVVQHDEMETAFAAATSPERQLPYWVAPHDVALYAAFLCLCYGTTAEMTALADHVSALEWVPQLRQCLVHFTQAQYQACWNCVAGGGGGGGSHDENNTNSSNNNSWNSSLPLALAVDPFLGPFVPQLLAGMRRKVLQHYWRPYSRVPLTTMAHDLGSSLVPSLDALRQEWMHMILQEQQQEQQSHPYSNSKSDSNDAATSNGGASIAAGDQDWYYQQQALANTRLNLVTDTLHRDLDDPEMIQSKLRALQLSQVTQQMLDDSYAMVIRLACQESDISVLNAAAGYGGGRDGPEYWRAGGGGGGGRRGRGGGRSGGAMGDPHRMDEDDEDDDYGEDHLILMGGGGGGGGGDVSGGGMMVGHNDDDNAVVDAMNPEDLY